MEPSVPAEEELAFAEEILNRNFLTMAYLRSLLAGDFHLEFLGEDFLLLHEKDIFVLKQCHKNGIICGEADAQLWSEMNYLGDEVLFSNPLLDNRVNIQKLMLFLKLPREAFHSCILFDTQCELRRVPRAGENFSVMRVDELEDFFAAFPQLPVRYSHTQLDALHDIFLLVSGGE